MQQSNFQSKPRRLPGIHGLRAIAAMGIVVVHVVHVPSPPLVVPPVLVWIIWSLWFGVPLFFILSAFSLLYAHESDVGKHGWVRDYLIKRIFRIAPLFWFMIIIYCIFVWNKPTPWNVIIANTIFYFNFIPSIHESIVAAGWTVGVEMPFYLCLPLLIGRIQRPSQAILLLFGLLTISIASRLWLAQDPMFAAGYSRRAFASNLGIFAVGIAAYFGAKTWSEQNRIWFWVAMVTSFWILMMPLGLKASPVFDGHPHVLFWSLPLGLLCAWQAVHPSRWLSITPMQWIGERSYSVYLLHPVIVAFMIRFGVYPAIYDALQPAIGAWSVLACLVVTFAVLFPAAGLTYWLIEMPGQNLGRALIRRLHRREAYPAPTAT